MLVRAGSTSTEVRNYKRKQESKKTRKKEKRTRPQESDQVKKKKKKTVKKTRKYDLFYLVAFLIEFFFSWSSSFFLFFFYKFSPLFVSRSANDYLSRLYKMLYTQSNTHTPNTQKDMQTFKIIDRSVYFFNHLINIKNIVI